MRLHILQVLTVFSFCLLIVGVNAAPLDQAVTPKKDLYIPILNNRLIAKAMPLKEYAFIKETPTKFLFLYPIDSGSTIAMINKYDRLKNPTADFSTGVLKIRSQVNSEILYGFIPLTAGDAYPVVQVGPDTYKVQYSFRTFSTNVTIPAVECTLISAPTRDPSVTPTPPGPYSIKSIRDFRSEVMIPAMAGDAAAQYRYACSLISGQHVQQDVNNAFEFFFQSARAGHTGAAFAVSFLHDAGAEFPFKGVESSIFYTRAKDALSSAVGDVPLTDGTFLPSCSVHRFDKQHLIVFSAGTMINIAWGNIRKTDESFLDLAIEFAECFRQGQAKALEKRQALKRDNDAKEQQRMADELREELFWREQMRIENARRAKELEAFIATNVRQEYMANVENGELVIGMNVIEACLAHGIPDNVHTSQSRDGDYSVAGYADGTELWFFDNSLEKIERRFSF